MKVPFLKGQAFPRFLVFGEEATIHSLRGLFKRNGLIGKHHFVVANEASAADGHAGPFISLKGFTHVVYDCRAFSFSTIIRLLSRHRKMGLRLGIYNPESRVLVTSENVISDHETYLFCKRTYSPSCYGTGGSGADL